MSSDDGVIPAAMRGGSRVEAPKEEAEVKGPSPPPVLKTVAAASVGGLTGALPVEVAPAVEVGVGAASVRDPQLIVCWTFAGPKFSFERFILYSVPLL